MHCTRCIRFYDGSIGKGVFIEEHNILLVILREREWLLFYQQEFIMRYHCSNAALRSDERNIGWI